MVVCFRESRIYQRYGDGWSYYSQRCRRYFLNEATNDCPLNHAFPILVSPVADSFKIEGPVADFRMVPLANTVSDFEDDSEWSTLAEGFDHAINDPTILLDKFILPEDGCKGLVEGIRAGTACAVSDGSFNEASPLGPAGTSAVILASSTSCHKKHWTKGFNWVTGPGSSQSAYRSELAGVISALTIVDILVCHNNITEGAITFALDGKTAMEESRGDWPLSIDQKCFDYLQVIQKWIKLSPLTITFRHVKGHQMKELEYHQLDWRGQRNEDVDGAAKAFLRQCTSGPQRDRRVYNQPILHLENGPLLTTVLN